MNIYLVGGAVRDKLLGLPIKERDYVVVGATIQEMLDLGYRQVGKDFPVFLHPKTQEEYALARRERKVDLGYKGFTFDASTEVSLTEDLGRRDLTINAMALSSSGELIDPFHGKDDIEHKKLRHVSQAFLEDPVRILRIARFQARFHYLGFTIARETQALMQEMVKAGEVNALVAERVWKEWERALSEANPEQFFLVLQQCGALTILFPQLHYSDLNINALKFAAAITSDVMVRCAAFLYLTDATAIAEIANRYRLPHAYRDLAKLTAKYYQEALNAKTLSVDALLTLFSHLDVYRREHRFQQFLIASSAIAHAEEKVLPIDWLQGLVQTVKTIDVKVLLDAGLTHGALVEALNNARREKITQWLNTDQTA